MEYIKHLLIRTPFEKPAQKLQELLKFRRRSQHPELGEIYMEPLRMEQAMQRILFDSANCLDIGCHLGSMLSDILRLAPKGDHIAFEPTPYKARWLKQKFPEIEIREIALSDTSGETKFYVNTSRSGFSGLGKPNPNPKNNETLLEINIQCERLDNILSPEYRVDFIKIDVEGYELAVLRGAADTLKRYRPTLLFECTRGGLSRSGFTSTQIFDFLTQHQSYSIFLLKDFLKDNPPLDYERFNNALQYPFQAFNFIAIAKS